MIRILVLSFLNRPDDLSHLLDALRDIAILLHPFEFLFGFFLPLEWIHETLEILECLSDWETESPGLMRFVRTLEKSSAGELIREETEISVLNLILPCERIPFHILDLAL